MRRMRAYDCLAVTSRASLVVGAAVARRCWLMSGVPSTMVEGSLAGHSHSDCSGMKGMATGCTATLAALPRPISASAKAPVDVRHRSDHWKGARESMLRKSATQQGRRRMQSRAAAPPLMVTYTGSNSRAMYLLSRSVLPLFARTMAPA